jgi:hypothetical protein
MNRGVLVLFVAALMLADLAPLGACGDKFLGAGRGPRFSKVYAAVYPGRLVLYTPAKGDLAGMSKEGLDKALRRAGHQVAVVSDRATLLKTLQEKAVDVVVVDAPQSVDVTSLTREIASRPSVIPVAKETINFLKTVDETMKARLSLRAFGSGGGK